MSYYWFSRKEILQKGKEKYSKENAAEYYLENKEAIKKKSKNRCKSLSEDEKDKIKENQRQRYQQLFSTKNKHYKINDFCFCSVYERVKRH